MIENDSIERDHVCYSDVVLLPLNEWYLSMEPVHYDISPRQADSVSFAGYERKTIYSSIYHRYTSGCHDRHLVFLVLVLSSSIEHIG